MIKYEKKFRSRTGLLVSVSDSDYNVDGSGTILRRDSGWKLWYNEDYKKMAPGITTAFVWANPEKMIKCGYPSDADTINRSTNGMIDRCGLHLNVGMRQVVLLIAVTLVLIATATTRFFETDISFTITTAIFTAGFLILGLWLFQWIAGGWAIFEESTQCSDYQECVDTVLQRAREVYSCPNGHSRARVMFATASAFAVAFAVYIVCDMYSLTFRVSAAIMSTAIVVLWGVLGYIHGDPVLNPFGIRKCTFENEFVINRAKQATGINEWNKNDFEKPTAIALLRKSETFKLLPKDKTKLRNMFPKLDLFYITYTSNDSEPLFTMVEEGAGSGSASPV